MKDWDNRRFFLAVAQEGSIRRAAERLDTSRSTVLRRISLLEKELGIRVFERRPEGYFTTPAGDELQRVTLQMELASDAVDRQLAGMDTKLDGTIRVAVPGALTTYVLMPDFAEFCVKHPDIKLEIISNYEMVDLARREADVAIRISNDPPEDLVGRRVLKIARAAYVGAMHLPSATSKKPIAKLGWIGWSLSPSSLQWVEVSSHPDLPVTQIVTDPHSTVAAIRAGMGMSILPCFMGDVEPGLYRMPPGELQLQSDLWVLTHNDLRHTARIRLFTEFIVGALNRHRGLLEGKVPLLSPTNTRSGATE